MIRKEMVKNVSASARAKATRPVTKRQMKSEIHIFLSLLSLLFYLVAHCIGPIYPSETKIKKKNLNIIQVNNMMTGKNKKITDSIVEPTICIPKIT